MRRRLFLSAIIIALLFLATAPMVAAAQTGDDASHVVQRGETLASIARQHGVTLEALVRANGLSNPSLIYAGQQLVIPGRGEEAQPAGPAAAAETSHVVAAGETLTAVANRYGVSVNELAQANGIANPSQIAVGQQLIIPASGQAAAASQAPAETAEESDPTTYVVGPGDTLASIASRYETSVAALAAVNGINNPSLIAMGQELVIPDGSVAPVVRPQAGLEFRASIGQQRCWVFQNGNLLYNWPCSTGRAGAGTKTGTFYVQSKIREAWGSAWDFYMPYWLGIYWAGSTENGIHGLPYPPGGQPIWANALGTPVTFGCVLLGAVESRALWEMAYIGMPVTITY